MFSRRFSFDHLPFVKDAETMEPIRTVSDAEILKFMCATGIHCYDVFYEPGHEDNKLSPIRYLYHVKTIDENLQNDYGLKSIWTVEDQNQQDLSLVLYDEQVSSMVADDLSLVLYDEQVLSIVADDGQVSSQARKTKTKLRAIQDRLKSSKKVAKMKALEKRLF